MSIKPQILGLVAIVVMLFDSAVTADDQARFFENQVRPILAEHCSACHGEKKQEGGLRVDSRPTLFEGGQRGAAIIPGEAESSLLVQAIRRTGQLKMHPDAALSAQQIETLVQWIDLGAPWPETTRSLLAPIADAAAQHWAFQPLSVPKLPNVTKDGWPRGPVDTFVLAQLEQASLDHAPEADRRTLLRRLVYTLTGLPPTPAEVREFVDDPTPDAYERALDRWLESPAYGQQWARHWLDVARYSDTKGYVYAREERSWVHAWSYRDWVTRAMNDDLPYDRFLLLQLAADQVEPRENDDLAAMGFLTLGRRFLGVNRDIIDDRIDVVCRGTMGLTVGCARCHDHKYDPIPTADYYSLYGVFGSCAEQLKRLDDGSLFDETYQQELESRKQKLASQMAESRHASSNRVRERIGDYLQAQTELHKYPAQGFNQILEPTDLLPAFVRRWETYLRGARRNADPIFVVWHAFAELPADSFSERAVEVSRRLVQATDSRINPIVAQAFASTPASFQEVIEQYAAIFRTISTEWEQTLEPAASDETEAPVGFDDSHKERLRRVLHGPGAPCEVPDEPIVHTESFFDTGTCQTLWSMQGEVDRWILQSPQPDPHALALVDRLEPTEPRVFRRGNPMDQGDEVPRQFLSLLVGDNRKPFQHGSGRLELAQAIIDPRNPLTARVIVNRVWAHHFGQGLVDSPSDFGTRANAPSHPRLLDWLSARFVQEGWSLKKLHRWILSSSTFRQQSTGPANPRSLARARELDPRNRFLWRMNQRRLSFEEARDSLLAASGELDCRIGGKPVDLFSKPSPTRRTLYGLVDRQFLPGTLRMFDFANPDLHIAQRVETTVPQQALFFLNHPLVYQRASKFSRLAEDNTQPVAVRELFARIHQREPSDVELADALELVSAAEQNEPSQVPLTVADWQYGYGELDEDSRQVTGFTRLPFFTGDAWQGGPNLPDPQLGWVQLTAGGGHPGNDRRRASIRRWTAPRSMMVAIQSQLTHEPDIGDGIRAFIVASRDGVIHSTTAHQQERELNTEAIPVEAGDTIDFVVDIGDVLNSDQYLWSIRLNQMPLGVEAAVWDSKKEFAGAAPVLLTAWAQLAHVLFCSNEFLFVD